VTKQFAQTTTAAVAEVTLLLQGEILALLNHRVAGNNATGLIAGFEQPEVGTVEIAVHCGSGVLVPPERCLGMVFQDYALFPI